MTNLINLIHITHLPGVTVDVTREPLKKDETLSTVLLVKWYGLLDSVSI